MTRPATRPGPRGRLAPTLASLGAALLLALALPAAAGAQAEGEGAAADLRVCAGGDVTLGTNLDTSWVHTAARRYGSQPRALPPPAELLAPLAPLVAGADLLLLNVEAAIGEGRAPSKCRPGSTACFALRQPVAAARAMRALAPDAQVAGNLANNHARDAGEPGFEATRRHLERAGVLVTGADTVPTLVAVAEGDTVALLGYATSIKGPDARDLAALRRHVRRAAERHGRVIVTVHMGAEGAKAQRTLNRRETYYGENRGNPVAFARAATDAGASLVIGHGPHVLRALEWRGDRLVAYSLGNLVTHGPFLNHEPINRGAILCATLAGDGAVRDAVVHATWQERPGVVAPDPTGRATVLLDSLSRLDFPRTGARVTAEGQVRQRGAAPTPVRKDPPR